MIGLAIVLLVFGSTLLGCFAMDTHRWLREIDRRLDAIEAGPSPRGERE